LTAAVAKLVERRHDIQHNDTIYNDIWHNSKIKLERITTLSKMAKCFHAECCDAECPKWPLYAECRYAECHYAECVGADRARDY
jgi:hypothetical protein